MAALISEAQEFVEKTLGRSLDGSFGDALKNGVILCEFRMYHDLILNYSVGWVETGPCLCFSVSAG